MQTYTLLTFAENKPGVLSKIFSMLRRRRYNVETITAGHTEKAGISRITLTFTTDEQQIDQIVKQINKIIEVTDIKNVTDEKTVERELVLIKVKNSSAKTAEVIQIAKIFRAQVVDVSEKSLIVQVTGNEEKVNRLIELLKKYGTMEIARTGKTAMIRG